MLTGNWKPSYQTFFVKHANMSCQLFFISVFITNMSDVTVTMVRANNNF